NLTSGRLLVASSLYTLAFSKEYHIKDIIVHSDYQFGTFENDYNDYVQPICLPDSAHFLSKGKHILQEAQVDIIPLQICNSYDWYGGTVSLKMVCAGSESGHVDSCQQHLSFIIHFVGDSGGPLVCYFQDTNKYYLIGITSSGVGCGRPKFPGLYKALQWVCNLFKEH
ncbi:hypothetical protein E2320_001391, partial [Naja naja]